MSFPTAMTRALLPAAILVPATFLMAAPVLAQNAGSDMARLRTHISSVQSMTANFTQTDPRGRSATGTMQLKRPGKVRFAYSGNDLLLVANGKTLTFIDYTVGQKSSWPLGRTPLGVLLSSSPDYVQAVTEEPEDGGYLFDGQPTGEDDAETQLYRKAIQIVAESQKASTSYLQRQLRVGYNSAARLIERMEKDGLVGQPDHVGRREVLIDTDGHPL